MIQKKWLRLALIVAIAGAILTVYASGAEKLLSFSNLKMHRDALIQYTDQHYVLILVATAALYVLLVTLSIPVADMLTLVCGMLFGRWVGTVEVVVAAATGATLAMLLIRYLARDAVRSSLMHRPRVHAVMTAFEHHCDSYLLVMRLVPAFPFWFVNVVMALTTMSVRRFFLFTLLGIVPGSFIYTNVGANIATIDSAHDLISLQTVLALSLLVLLSVSPSIVCSILRRRSH